MQRRKFLISGRVQGVGFRMWTQSSAGSLDLSGWVRNLSSGEVETLLIGPEDALNAFAQKLNHGPSNPSPSPLPAAEVSSVKELELSEEDQQYPATEFRILPTE